MHFALWGVVFCLDLGPFLFSSSLVLLSGVYSFIYVIIYFIGCCIILEVPLLIFHLHLLKENLMQFFAVGKKPIPAKNQPSTQYHNPMGLKGLKTLPNYRIKMSI